MDSAHQRRLVKELLGQAGSTFAERAGITLKDTPSPLYELLVLSVLLSTRITSDIAVDAARELNRAGDRTPQGMLKASWQDRVDALGRAHYRRYDESTATRLGENAQLLLDRYSGDLRKLADAADGDTGRAAELLQEFPGIGPVGADIFLREVQAVWSWVRPYAGERILTTAAELGLPDTAEELAELAGTRDLSALTSALIDVSQHQDLRERVLEAVG